MTIKYISREGDTVDLIAWRYYGRQDARVVEQLLAANPHLAGHGPVLPGGAELVLPEIQASTQSQGLRLWD